MRRIVTFPWLSADGHVAGPDGNLDWVVPDDEQARAAAAGMAAIVLLRYVRAPGGR